MNSSTKAWIWLGTLGIALMLASDARAAFTFVGDKSATGTLQDWIDLGSTGLQQKDKLWVYSESTLLPGTTPISFTTKTLGDGTNVYTLTIGRVGSTENGATLHYTIQIVPSGSTQYAFSSTTLDTATTGCGTSLVEGLASADGATIMTLSSTNGSSQVAATPVGLQFLDVNEVWNIAAHSSIGQTFITFSQTPMTQSEGDDPSTDGVVAEPGTIAIWSLLLTGAAIVLAVRRCTKPSDIFADDRR